MKVGQEALYRRRMGGYGFLVTSTVKVLKIGKRITIEIPKMNGDSRVAHVDPKSLSVTGDHSERPTHRGNG